MRVTFNYIFFDETSADMFERFVNSMSVEYVRDNDNIQVTADTKIHSVLAKKAIELF